MRVVRAANQASVAVVSYHVVLMASARRRGMAVWSQTPM